MQLPNGGQPKITVFTPAAELGEGLDICGARVLLRMVAAKNSRKCSLALSPATAMMAGTGNSRH